MIRKFGAVLGAVAALALVAPADAQKFSDSYSFLKAVRERDGAKATELLAQPGSVVANATERDDGDGALHLVVRDRDLNWLGFLLSKGARPDLQNDEGSTALQLAAQLGWVEGAQILLSARASVDLANSRGETPLIFAVHQRNLPMVRLLVAAGANPNRTDSIAGYSALDYAKRDARSSGLVKVLEEGGKKPTRGMAGPTL